MAEQQWEELTLQIQKALVRDDVYGLLASAFLPPDPTMKAALESGDFTAALEECVERLSEPYVAARESLKRLQAALNGFSFERWQSEYAQVFGHTIAKDYPPY